MKTGASAAPIVGRDFISAVYLSKDPVFDWSDMRIGAVPNEIGKPHLKTRLHVPAMSSQSEYVQCEQFLHSTI